MIQAAKKWWSRFGIGTGSAGYDAIDEAGKRKAIWGNIRTADELLSSDRRARLANNTRDLERNFSIASWAIRKHLDYVSAFSFQSRTGDEQLDRRVEELMRWYSEPRNCDVGGRHSMPRLIRLAEMMRVLDGDVLLVKLGSGLLQPIEADRVRDPDRDNLGDGERWINGVRVSKGGRPQAYAVHSRREGRYEYERSISASNAIHLGYFQSFDQVRGVSPMASAINSFRDVYEGIGYALAKAKVSQLFALSFFRDAPDGFGAEEDGERSQYKVDFGKGPVMLDLDAGDRAEFLESRQPSSEFQAFTTMVVSAALKSLDIPFSFFDESFTNFYGSRAALLHYVKSCQAKRAEIREALDAITLWRLSLFIANGTLEIPATMTVRDLSWEWIPDGVVWWDPAKDIEADARAIELGLRTRSEIRKERYGDDWRDVVDSLAAENEYMERAGLRLGPPQPMPQPVPAEPESDTEPAAEDEPTMEPEESME